MNPKQREAALRLADELERAWSVHLRPLDAAATLLRELAAEPVRGFYEPYDKMTANAQDRIAWALCQIIDADAPMRWTRYRFAAECIARNPELMADLATLSHPPVLGWR